MKKLFFIISLLCFFGITLSAQIIEGISNKKYVSLTKKPKVTIPVITWNYPSTDYYSSTLKSHTIEACITSQEAPSDIMLYIDRVPQNTRNFKITPVNNSCDYTWKLTINLGNVGKYFIELEVKNTAGKTSASRIIEVIDDSKTSPTPEVSGRKLALVIGNSDYDQKSLVNPVNDAVDMTAKLENLGFKVYKHTNLDKRAMNNAVSDFTNNIQKGDIALFFYAGHGYQINGASYLLPVGAIASINDEADAEYEGYRMDRILEKMQLAGARTNLVFLDACRDNPVRSVFRSTSNNGGLAFPKTTPSGFLISFATQGGSTASDGQGRNGTYTAALLKYLENGNSINDILTMVNGEVKRQTNGQQVPEFKTSLDNIFKF